MASKTTKTLKIVRKTTIKDPVPDPKLSLSSKDEVLSESDEEVEDILSDVDEMSDVEISDDNMSENSDSSDLLAGYDSDAIADDMHKICLSSEDEEDFDNDDYCTSSDEDDDM